MKTTIPEPTQQAELPRLVDLNEHMELDLRRAMRACAMRWRRDSNLTSKKTDLSLLHGLIFPNGNAAYWLKEAIEHRNRLRCQKSPQNRSTIDQVAFLGVDPCPDKGQSERASVDQLKQSTQQTA